ncbi:MAG: pilus assembly protein N-terminal domain-containing protein [Pirellulaceae bacterium]|nr:pilus assembly protein N-terminal domain-containing protein [Pirellulaceae bacterium]
MRIVCGPPNLPRLLLIALAVTATQADVARCQQTGLQAAPRIAQANVPALGNAQPGASRAETPGPPIIINSAPPANYTNDSLGEPAEPVSRVQGGLPVELILPPPSDEVRALAKRFVRAEIDPQLPLSLAVGRPKILQFNETPMRIFLPGDDIVTAEILDQKSGREIGLTGLKPGSATLTLWFEDPSSPEGKAIVSYLVQVYKDPLLTRPLGNLQDEINASFPNCFIELTELGGRLVVKGQAQDAVQVVQILQILAGARGVTSAITRVNNTPTVTNALNFTQPDDQLAQEEEAALRRETLDPLALARAGIVNLIRIPGEQQVMLRVTVAEVNRNAARSIGLNFSVDDDNGSVFRSVTGGVSGNLLTSLDSGQVRLAIEALRKMSLSKTLAEPNLVTLNGMPANFQAGGEFPIPIISAGGAGIGQNLQGVAFIPFGVQLRFVPLIQDRDVIRLQLRAQVSTRDESLGTNIGGGAGGTAVAGLNSRTVSTNVELRSGQTLAVAGILQTNFGSSSDRVPFWGDLPVIGALGGINRSSAGEQELVILVTPELVAPVDACALPSLPGSDALEPTDIEFFVKNRLESRRGQDFRSSVRTDFARQRVPDRCCPDQYLIGPVGPSDRALSPLAPPHAALQSPLAAQARTPMHMNSNTPHMNSANMPTAQGAGVVSAAPTVNQPSSEMAVQP